MFATAEMSRLTVAAPVDKMEEVLRMCASLSCVHIEEYGHFQDGIGVGRALSTEGANKTSAMLTKVRAVSSSVQAINTDGPMPLNEAKKLVDAFEFLEGSLNSAGGWISWCHIWTLWVAVR